MKVLVCGGRDFKDYEKLWNFLDDFHKQYTITEIIHGAAKGADLYAHVWAVGRKVPVSSVPADWKTYRNAAGPIRNSQMLKLSPDYVIAFSGGRGTANMVQQAIKAGVQVITVS